MSRKENGGERGSAGVKGSPGCWLWAAVVPQAAPSHPLHAPEHPAAISGAAAQHPAARPPAAAAAPLPGLLLAGLLLGRRHCQLLLLLRAPVLWIP